MKIIEDIYGARALILAQHPAPPIMRILMHPETYYQLCVSHEFRDMMMMQGFKLTPELFGIKIIETSEIEGWELTVVAGSGNGAAKAA